MMLAKLLIGLCLLQLALSEATTSTTVDFTESFLQGKKLQRIDRVVDVNTTFQLLTTGAWSKFRDMSVFFDLSYAQYVPFQYSINWGSSSTCTMAVRLIVDGKEERAFRAHTGYVYWPQLHRSSEVYLSEGRHEAVVEYRTGCNGSWNPYDTDWALAFFRMHYHNIVDEN